MAGRFDMQSEFSKLPPWPSRTRVFTVAPRVLIDNKASATNTVIEVNGRDRPGFLNQVAWTLNKLGLQITTARVSTFGERVVDVFYVKDVFGLKVEHEGKLEQIHDALLTAIGGKESASNNEPVPAPPKTAAE
jgi:[protein-PII] uridylyltransferase